MAPFSIAVSTLTQPTKLPEVVSHLWVRLLELYLGLRSEYVQVLVLVVVPLILLLAVLLVDLGIRGRVVAQDGRLTFRPSLVVRCGWVFGMLLLLFNSFASHHPNWIIMTADLLAAWELLRTFPRNLTLAPEGLVWRDIRGKVSLPWEQISRFAAKRSPFGVEYKVCGDGGQSFAIESMVFPGWKQIIRGISLRLERRHLNPSSAVPPTALDTLHRVLLPACMIIIVFGHLRGYK